MVQTLGSLFYLMGLRQRAEMTAALRPFGLTLAEYVCLRLLAETPGMSSAELARAIDVTPQTMNVTLNGLQDAGLVVRPDSVPNGRARPTSLSKKGDALAQSLAPAVKSAEDLVLEHLSPAERRELRRLLAVAAQVR